MLGGKRIIVGITGSIAAYKAAVLVRSLVREGAEVRVLMTPLAKEFIAPLTLATLAKSPVLTEFFNPENGQWNSHVSLGEWADLCLIAPATANTIGKMAAGIADNLLLTTCLSARCPVFVAPAMDMDMYAHPAVQRNLRMLESFGGRIIEPECGDLASGLSGKGRMAEPEAIVEYLKSYFASTQSLAGLKAMVTAGGTVEAIDPVRFISNHSSGKMGYAIAEELARRGAEVTVIKGRVSVPAAGPGIREIEALSAGEMYTAATEEFENSDIAVMCAAVADYAPAVKETSKIKRKDGKWNIELVPTKDIAAALGRNKGGKILAGFALETDNGTENALEKMKRKNLDFIVLNSLGNEGAGFGHDTNRISILCRDGKKIDYNLKPKTEAAADIVDFIESYLNK